MLCDAVRCDACACRACACVGGWLRLRDGFSEARGCDALLEGEQLTPRVHHSQAEMRADAFSHLPASLERAPLLLAHTDRSPDYVTGADGVQQQQQPAADSPLAKLASTPKLHEKGSPAMRLKALGISLEGRASTPIGNYVPAVLTGDILTISGQLPKAALSCMYRMHMPMPMHMEMHNGGDE